MTTITIYTETHRHACLYDADEMDAHVYDENIDHYYCHLEERAKRENINIEYDSRGWGRVYYSDTKAGDDFMLRTNDFWDWFQG